MLHFLTFNPSLTPSWLCAYLGFLPASPGSTPLSSWSCPFLKGNFYRGGGSLN
jgi:hypothetical protein